MHSVSLAGPSVISPDFIPRDDPAVRATKVGVATGKLFRRGVVDDCPAPLTPSEQAHGFHKIQRFAHRARADPELARQIALIGDHGAGLPLSGGNALDQRVAQLQVKWSGQKAVHGSARA
jgi:hypothetical protein